MKRSRMRLRVARQISMWNSRSSFRYPCGSSSCFDHCVEERPKAGKVLIGQGSGRSRGDGRLEDKARVVQFEKQLPNLGLRQPLNEQRAQIVPLGDWPQHDPPSLRDLDHVERTQDFEGLSRDRSRHSELDQDLQFGRRPAVGELAFGDSPHQHGGHLGWQSTELDLRGHGDRFTSAKRSAEAPIAVRDNARFGRRRVPS